MSRFLSFLISEMPLRSSSRWRRNNYLGIKSESTSRRGEKEIKEVRGEESFSLGQTVKYPVIYRSLHAYRAALLILREREY